MTATTGQWPNGANAAISLTMDNMGEANELELGSWPADVAIGQHHSLEHLPKMLDLLDTHNISATYFIESWNTDHYPDAIENVAARGHEVGFHGYRHEYWTALTQAREIELIEDAVSRASKLGLTLRGFRPPGGTITPDTLRLLRENGFDYISPVATEAAILDDVVILPFRWEWIDAYFYLDLVAKMRTARGDTEALLPASRLVTDFTAAIEQLATSGGYTALLFHPFLQSTDERLEAMATILDQLQSHPRIWCAPCGEVSDWVSSHPELFGSDPGWENSTWR
jgi:peptidoglycan/xylan/chitin deacetylase (PgdA/CDA1 family)